MGKAEVYSRTRLTESYWPADTESKPLVEWTVGETLRKVAAEVPDRIALVEGHADPCKRRRWTYAQLLADAERVAFALLTKFKPGEHVAVWGDNIPEWVLMEYGCALAGMVLVTVNPAYRARELEYVLTQSGAVGLFCIEEYRGHDTLETAKQVQKNVPALRELYSFSKFDEFLDSGCNSLILPEVKPEDPFMIMYTSGTTGVQKGVLLHHMGCMNTNYFVAERAGLAVGGVWVNPMPLFHIGSCGLAVLGPLRQFGTHVLAPGFDVPLLLELFEKEKGTFSLLVPTMLESILAFPDLKKYDLSRVKNLMSGSAMVEVQLIERVKRDIGADISIVFGQTETHGVVSGTHREDSPEDQSLTIGQALPHCEVMIVDPETGEVVPLGIDGEICIRGYQRMIGYYNMPEATAESRTGDGWHRTGDLGSMDERGFLKITGRLKDMIIRGGENIYPREIENLLLQHPKVGKVAVLGTPSQHWGEEVAAVIIPESPTDMPTATELDEYCQANMTSFKRPRLWYFTENFPLTLTGKLQKFMLRDRIVKGELQGERT